MSTATVVIVPSNLVSGLQVSGNTAYDGQNWKEAILSYLGGVWSGDVSVTSRQKLSINNTVIRLGDNNEYYAYYVCEPDNIRMAPVAPSDASAIICLSTKDTEVESALIRFTRNRKIRHLVLELNGTIIHLRKGQKQSRLHISTYGINSMSEVMRRLGYAV